jgi:hypothetical protein
MRSRSTAFSGPLTTTRPSQSCRSSILVIARVVKASPEEGISYVAQLAWWGLEEGLVEIPRPISPSQPDPHNLENAIGVLLGWGSEKAEFASRWFLSNPNLSEEEQAANLAWQLEHATSPQEAAEVAVQAAYDLMVATSA